MNQMYQYPEQQQPIQTSPYLSPMDNYSGAIILLTNPGEELRQLELTFEGKTEDATGNISDVARPLMNEEGIKKVMGVIKTIVNRVTIMSNLTNEEITKQMAYLADALARDLMQNRVNYGFKSFSDRTIVYRTCLVAAFICMKRAKEGDDKRFWKGSVQEIYTRGEMKSKQNSFLDRLWRR